MSDAPLKLAPDTLLTSATFRLLTGLSQPRVSQLVERGVVEQAGRGQFAADQVVRYWEWKLSVEKTVKNTDEDDRFRRARADKNEIEALEKMRVLVPAEQFFDEAKTPIIAHVRRLDALGVRIATRYGKDVAAVRNAANAEVRDIRESFADDLGNLSARLRGVVPAAKAAARKNAGRVGRKRKGTAGRKRGAG